MKTLIKKLISPQIFMIVLLALTSSLAMAEDYSFKFSFRGEVWKHVVKSNNKNSALEIASQDCLNHFTKSSGQGKIKVSADTADALLDTCANPR
jgi:hypothetical protein